MFSLRGNENIAAFLPNRTSLFINGLGIKSSLDWKILHCIPVFLLYVWTNRSEHTETHGYGFENDLETVGF